ncbi:hypothetical protein Tco_1053863 [Tanacetum coccineum]|uniref:Uncharacterized protein n=1 Tax=Tanacetum coccineum TaxID=301880 RepID=A0ABQ5GV32_9ASTR
MEIYVRANSFILAKQRVKASLSFCEKDQIPPKSWSKKAGGKNRLIESIQISSQFQYFLREVDQARFLRNSLNVFVKIVIDLPSNLFPLTKSVITPVKSGGLGIGSLKAFNLSFLSKWLWRWHTDKEPYGTTLFTRFMAQPEWLGTFKLTDVYPRLYALESMKDCNVSNRLIKLSGHFSLAWNWRHSICNGREKENMESLVCLLEGVELKSGPDGWCWSLESSEKFSVKSV